MTASPGSSPLARGPRLAFYPREGGKGLIPARAGTTDSQRSGGRGVRAHPRSRGDHAMSSRHGTGWLGSSPLARGPHLHTTAAILEAGLIPARAGTTARRDAWRGTHRAHPRSRGDHQAQGQRGNCCGGSSPLARGPPGGRSAANRRSGLIPARAGTTLADMGFYPLHQQNRITLKPEPKSRIHDKQQLLTTTSTAIPARLTPP